MDFIMHWIRLGELLLTSHGAAKVVFTFTTELRHITEFAAAMTQKVG